MSLWTASEIAAATGAVASGDFATTGVAFDSREVGPGDLFVALKGEATDGHRFLDACFAQGAAGAIVSAPTPHPHVLVADTTAALDALLVAEAPAYAVVDLKLGQSSGLACVRTLAERDPDTAIVVLTGYASIATAVEAVKLGATSYLAKPANTDEIEAAFGRAPGDIDAPIGDRPSSIKTLEWERIQATLAETGFNVSETARRLGMHRRTLARKLEKRPLR